MPLAAAIIPAVIGAGAAVYSSSQAKKAANKTATAEKAANDAALAAQQANFDRITGLNQPFISGGQGAYAKLLQQFGVTPMGGGQPTSPMSEPAPGYGSSVNNYSPGAAVKPPRSAQGDPNLLNGGVNDVGPRGGPVAPQIGQPIAQPVPAAPSGPEYPGAPHTTPGAPAHFDAQAYLTEYPDVLANARERVANGTASSVEQVAQEHYDLYGKSENRDQPMTGGTPDQVHPDLMNATRPDAGAAPTFTRPQDVGAPDLASYFTNFKADPGYAYRQSEAAKGVNSGFAAKGLLRSGAAAKALEDRAFNLADQTYNNWWQQQLQRAQLDQNAYQYGQGRQDANFGNDRAYGTALWQYGTDRGDQNFNNDRGYQTNRYDTNNANLFDLTRIGVGAAGNVSGAGTNFANAQSNIYGNQAQSTGDRAYANANANSGLVGGLAGAATNLFANYGGGGSYGAPGTYGASYAGAKNGSAYGQPGASPFTIF